MATIDQVPNMPLEYTILEVADMVQDFIVRDPHPSRGGTFEDPLNPMPLEGSDSFCVYSMGEVIFVHHMLSPKYDHASNEGPPLDPTAIAEILNDYHPSFERLWRGLGFEPITYFQQRNSFQVNPILVNDLFHIVPNQGRPYVKLNTRGKAFHIYLPLQKAQYRRLGITSESEGDLDEDDDVESTIRDSASVDSTIPDSYDVVYSGEEGDDISTEVYSDISTVVYSDMSRENYTAEFLATL